MLINSRVSFFTGLPQIDYRCPHPTVVQHLKSVENGTWMTDLPCEMFQMHEELAVHARGKVLIGGLGLGILPRMVARMRQVESITVVEQSEEVCNLVWPFLSHRMEGKARIVNADIHKFEIAKGDFDVALLDTWQGTGEWVWMNEVVPLRRKFAQNVKRIACWQEDVMRMQVHMGLFNYASMPPDKLFNRYLRHQYAFNRALDDEGIMRPKYYADGSPLDMEKRMQFQGENMQNARICAMATEFLYHVGSRDWEDHFGKHWDEIDTLK